MSGNLRLYGATSGYSQISAPDVAGDQIFVVPSLGGEVIVSGNNQSLDLGTGDLSAAAGTFSADVKVGKATALGDADNFWLQSTSTGGSAKVTGVLTGSAFVSYYVNGGTGNHFTGQYDNAANFQIDHLGNTSIGGDVAGGSPNITLNVNGRASFGPSAGSSRRVNIEATDPANGNGLFLYNPTNGPASDMMTIQCGTNTGDTSTRYINFRRADGTIVGYVVMNGASAVNFSTTSDYRLKENVTNLTDAVDRLKQLQVHRFNFISEPGRTIDGFIAHEAQAIVPESVTGEKDGVDADGAPIYQGIDQSKLVPLLTAALQTALTRIEALEAEVQALKDN